MICGELKVRPRCRVYHMKACQKGYSKVSKVRSNQRHALPPHIATSSMPLLLVDVAIRGSVSGRAAAIVVVGTIVAITVVIRTI